MRPGAPARPTPACWRGLGPELRVARLGPALPRQEVVKGFADREGVALVATDNFDAAGDPEEPALRALEELVPAWRRRDLSLRVRVISDWPTPGLALAASRAGAEVVPSDGDLVGALGTARLAVGPVHHGTSASSWVPAAMAAGTPWLVTAKGLEGSDLADIDARGRRRRLHHGVPRMAVALRRNGMDRGSRRSERPGLGLRRRTGEATLRSGLTAAGHRPAGGTALARGTLAGAPGHAAGQGGPAPCRLWPTRPPFSWLTA